MEYRKTPSTGLRTLAFFGLPVLIIGVAMLFASQPSTAQQPIVQGVKPLPIMRYTEGRDIFEVNCAQCHGELADGREGLGPPLAHPIYRRGHHSNTAFYRAVERGSRAHHWPFGDMPAQPQVTRTDMTEVINYLRELQHHNGIN